MEWHPFDKGGKWLIQHHGDSILRLVGVGGVWLGFYLWQVRQWPLFPEYNPEEAGSHGQDTHH